MSIEKPLTPEERENLKEATIQEGKMLEEGAEFNEEGDFIATERQVEKAQNEMQRARNAQAEKQMTKDQLRESVERENYVLREIDDREYTHELMGTMKFGVKSVHDEGADKKRLEFDASLIEHLRSMHEREQRIKESIEAQGITEGDQIEAEVKIPWPSIHALSIVDLTEDPHSLVTINGKVLHMTKEGGSFVLDVELKEGSPAYNRFGHRGIPYFRLENIRKLSGEV